MKYELVKYITEGENSEREVIAESNNYEELRKQRPGDLLRDGVYTTYKLEINYEKKR